MRSTLVTLLAVCVALSSAQCTYDYTNEGTDWTGTCATGTSQSPINIVRHTSVKGSDKDDVKFNYADELSASTLNDFCSTVDATPDDTTDFVLKGSVLGDEYELISVEYRTPSEHRLDGVAFPLELQALHQNADGDYAAVAFFFVEGEDAHPQLDLFVRDLPSSSSSSEAASINYADLLPEKKKFYHYEGSLTTPPCNESVDWFVMYEVQSASSDQIDALEAQHGDNVRALQDLNDREITVYYNRGDDHDKMKMMDDDMKEGMNGLPTKVFLPLFLCLAASALTFLHALCESQMTAPPPVKEEESEDITTLEAAMSLRTSSVRESERN